MASSISSSEEIGRDTSLFDSDLDRAAQLTSIRPLQLAIAGGSGLPVLENLADDPRFKGLAIVGMAETAYFDTQYATVRALKAVESSRWESPSKRGSFLIQRAVSHGLAMLDDDYQLSTVVFRLDPDWRPGVKGPYDEVWKAQETAAGGQTWIWRRLEHDPRLSKHTRNVWHQFYSAQPLDEETLKAVLVRTKIAVDKIRARGGDVVFVRPPSAPALRTVEDKHLPRARGWDAFSPTRTQTAFTLTIFPPRKTSLCRKNLISVTLARRFSRTLTRALWLNGHDC